MRPEELFIPALVFIAILIGLFLLLREVMCWYYKINKRIQLQEETNRLLKKLIGETISNSPISGPPTSLFELNERKEKGQITQEEYLKYVNKLK